MTSQDEFTSEQLEKIEAVKDDLERKLEPTVRFYNDMFRLERWLSSYELLTAPAEDQVQFLSFAYETSQLLFWLPWILHALGSHTDKQASIHPNKK